MTHDFLTALSSQVLLADGGIGTELLRRGAPRLSGPGRPESWTKLEDLTLDRPGHVLSVHHAYCRAGANIIGTNTFQAIGRTPGARRTSDHVRRLNASAARLACQVRDAWRRATPEEPRFVAGTIGPGPREPRVVHRRLVDDYRSQVAGLLEGGVDVLALETMQDIGVIEAVLEAIEEEAGLSGRRVPVCLSVTPDAASGTVGGVALDQFLRRLPIGPVAVVGINCGTGPAATAAALELTAQVVARPAAYQPSAGLPGPDGRYPSTPADFARATASSWSRGLARIVGGCCGTTPDHIRCLADAIGAPGRRATYLEDCDPRSTRHKI